MKATTKSAKTPKTTKESKENKAKFRKGRNTLVACRNCGAMTHSTIDGNIDLALCRRCQQQVGKENYHNDHHTAEQPDPKCKLCQKAFKLPTAHDASFRIIHLDKDLWENIKSLGHSHDIPARTAITQAVEIHGQSVIEELQRLGFGKKNTKRVRMAFDQRTLEALAAAKTATGVPAVTIMALCAARWCDAQREALPESQEAPVLESSAPAATTEPAATPEAPTGGRKTGVWCKWTLWTETADHIRNLVKDKGPDDLVFTSMTGEALVRVNGDVRRDLIQQQWHRFTQWIKIEPELSFKYLRKTGAQLMRDLVDKEASEVYLAHSEHGVSTHYSRPSLDKMHGGLARMRVVLGPMFAPLAKVAAA